MNELLTVTGLNKTYVNQGRRVHALRDISLFIKRGECLGVVGESGSGKSTLVRILLALEHPDSGEAYLHEVPIFKLQGKALRAIRRHIQVVFQDPSAALNQRLPIWRSIMEPLDNFKDIKPSFIADIRHSRRDTAARLLEMVGLQAEHMDRYPHELSGGQKQRVAIARGISLGPKLLICDEPTSSLDVSVQAQMLKLLKELGGELDMAYLFISHDIAAVSMMSDRFIIMKEGQIVDRFLRGQLLSEDRHAYTRQLIAAVM
ncbi:ABC transporter ATP-binding protein [Paenibacillus sp. sgz302251]|uniref:ABC transporter ATP-binding protein n=1 Tax=Paenibacillus sp. sgz302251 TaxID=3414493 RepID=UPI003C79E0FB